MAENEQQPTHGPVLRALADLIVGVLLPILYAGAWISSAITVASMLGIVCFDVPLVARISLYFWIKALLVDYLMKLAKI